MSQRLVSCKCDTPEIYSLTCKLAARKQKILDMSHNVLTTFETSSLPSCLYGVMQNYGTIFITALFNAPKGQFYFLE